MVQVKKKFLKKYKEFITTFTNDPNIFIANNAVYYLEELKIEKKSNNLQKNNKNDELKFLSKTSEVLNKFYPRIQMTYFGNNYHNFLREFSKRQSSLILLENYFLLWLKYYPKAYDHDVMNKIEQEINKLENKRDF